MLKSKIKSGGFLKGNEGWLYSSLRCVTLLSMMDAAILLNLCFQIFNVSVLELSHVIIGSCTGVCKIFAPCKAKSSNQALLTDYCHSVRGHKIIISHLICQNKEHFLDFASWCKDSAIPST